MLVILSCISKVFSRDYSVRDFQRECDRVYDSGRESLDGRK